ncbi:MAG: hypothetical protein IIA45_09470 [Bacteroidetes bacterium]|nr:hypothetical protein [Bacteroidota bacterium]
MKTYQALLVSGMLSLIVLISSCGKDEKVVLDFKYDYFPVEIGDWVIYDVETRVWDDIVGKDSKDVYQIKELVESTFIDNAGRTTYRIERYKRTSVNNSWNLLNVWYSNKEKLTAERTEDNLRYLKLVFPPKLGVTWEGNKYIFTGTNNTVDLDYMKDWDYEYTEVDVPLTVGGLSFDSTLTVIQRDYANVIEKVSFEEKYALHVGLIFKETMHLKKQSVDIMWEDAPEGSTLLMTIFDYSNKP